MTLRNIIKAIGHRKNWLKIDYDWSIDDTGRICPVLPVNLTLDTEVTIMYQWYHHMDPRIDTKEVYSVIENHDYLAFTKLHEKFLLEPFVYFDSEATIWAEGEPVGSLTVAYDPKVFALITGQDYECG